MRTEARRRQAIIRAIREHAGPFAWGVRDCVTFAAAVVREIRGAEPTAICWQSERDALAVIESRGGFIRAVTRALGKPVAYRLAKPRDGDVLLLANPASGFASNAAVWSGDGPLGMTLHGVARLDPADARLVWSV